MKCRLRAGSEFRFERLPQASERGRQLPVAIDGSMIESGGLVLQNTQKMQRIEL